MMDYSMIGAGVGLLPTLLKYLNGGNSNSTSPTGGMNANNPNNNMNNFQGSSLSAGDVAAVSPNPTQSVQAYNAAGGDPGTGAMQTLPAITNAGASAGKTGGLADALSGLTGAFGGAGASGLSAVPAGATQLPSAQVVHPNYGGTGTRMADSGMGMAPMMQPGGATTLGPLPSGPAATNPILLALLRQRLGGIG